MCKNIWRANFVYEFYGNIIKENIVKWAGEILKQVFLHTWLKALNFFVENYEWFVQYTVSNIFCKLVNKLDISRYIQIDGLYYMFCWSLNS